MAFIAPHPLLEGNTVYVLGAGASSEYEIPCGDRLADMVSSWVAGFDRNRPEVHALRHVPQPTLDKIRIFARAIRGIGNADLFLAQNPDLREAGRLCLARTIAQHENPDRLSGGWYRQLFRSMLPDDVASARPLDLVKSAVAFITFNYDRSLEQALYEHTRAFFRRSPQEECVKALASIPIIHVHGQLGRLPWQMDSESLDGIPVRDYSPSLGLEDFLAGSPIKITEETEPASREYEIAHHLLLKAKQIHFLGFGFHPANLLRLRFGAGMSRVPISGTHQGLGHSRRQELEKSGGEFGIPISLGTYPETVADYFHHVIGG